ncbi:DUF4011 domain-containing protein [Telmatocola sphagniphila]|uniref:DUF4011 domain-containing protein n=1 Tax=Telmatocola sphagniphila TaxID=1123043 RepID=A0A8E6B5Q4_9BACT|nr:DUF4011 domain-containing protein [Telmatocola sphagniphila]QVL31626.1 DUF4011 domain-containing protein [Telmatocola sphagniphila]
MTLDIEARIEEWMKLLLDTSARNKLISTKFGPRAALELLRPDAKQVWKSMLEGEAGISFAWKRDLLNDEQNDEGETDSELEGDDAERERHTDSEATIQLCLSSPKLRDEALSKLTDKRLDSRLKRLSLNAKVSLDERGVNTLYLAIGFLHWYEAENASSDHLAPLLLIPVHLSQENLIGNWRIAPLDEGAERNECLAERFRNDFKIQLPELAEESDDSEPLDSYIEFISSVQKILSKLPDRRWEIREDMIALGHFDSRKLPMWKDLQKNMKRIAAHRLCRLIAGDTDVLAHDPGIRPLEPEELDAQVPVSELLHILPADSSQHAAIEAVKKGIDLVLDGPPGTGKSQTIANIIADRIGAGKTVLFVSEKAAALQVVESRLREAGLGDFCLSLHDPSKTSRTSVCEEFKKGLALRPAAYDDPSVRQKKQQETREHLNRYVHALHEKREPLGLSFYEVYGKRARFTQIASQSRLIIPDAGAWDRHRLESVREALTQLHDARSVFADPERHPWQGCLPERLTEVLRDDMQHNLERLSHGLTEAERIAKEWSSMDWLPTRPNWNDFHVGINEAGRALDVPILHREWLSTDPQKALRAVQQMPAKTSTHRAAVKMLPEFDIETVCEDSEMPRAPDRSIPLKKPYFESIRSRLIEVQRVLERMLRMKSKSSLVRQTLEALTAIVPLPWETTPVTDLPDLLARLRAVVAVCPLPATWSKHEDRSERQILLARGKDALEKAETIRAGLLKEISLQAFSFEKAGLVEKAYPYRSRLRKLGFGWSSLKREWRTLYSTEFPKHAEFRNHVEQLDSFRRHHILVKELVATCPEFPGSELSARRWQTECDRLGAVVAFADGDNSLPLQPIFFEAEIEKPTLISLIDRASESVVGLISECAELDIILTLKQLATGGKITGRIQEMDELVAPVEMQLKNEILCLDRCVRWLRTDADVPFDVLSERMPTLQRLRNLRDEIDQLRNSFQPSLDLQQAIRREWRADAEAAEKGEAYLNRCATPLPEKDRKALSDEEYRQNLDRLRHRGIRVGTEGLTSAWSFLTEKLFPSSSSVSTGIVLEQSPLDEVVAWSESRRKDANRMEEWLTYQRVRRETRAVGVEEIIEEIHRKEVKLEEAAMAFESRFLAQWIDACSEPIKELSDFRFNKHERLIADFVERDKSLTASASDMIRSTLMNDSCRPSDIKWSSRDPKVRILKEEIQKKRSRKPIRKLFAEVSAPLLKLKPCWMMSPLAVSTFLDSPDFHFDVVIFDEASQIRPHDAICAIYRGKQLVVAGDPKQLPPTEIGVRNKVIANDDDDNSLLEHESILDVLLAKSLPQKRLTWHYRSKREELIAFSNQEIYGGELVSFPSPDDAGERPIQFVHTPHGRFIGNKNEIEAAVVADLVIEHFEHSPNQSLGVIAFSLKQQECINDALEKRRREKPHLEEHFNRFGLEPFFVKNLENVQGDARDHIILSVGYAKDEFGALAMRFGPLNKKGGERRLNVAITRSQHCMSIVSSMHPLEMDVDRLTNDGPKLLKTFLQFAMDGPQAIARKTNSVGEEHESPFEAAVAEQLRRVGILTKPQIGCAGYRIDLGAYDALQPGRFLLGIECDGAMYHSAATARDRDRLRQEVLESLGWKIVRIWSTDWFKNHKEQVERIVSEVEKAKKRYAEKELIPATNRRVVSQSPLLETATRNRKEHLADPQATLISKPVPSGLFV